MCPACFASMAVLLSGGAVSAWLALASRRLPLAEGDLDLTALGRDEAELPHGVASVKHRDEYASG